MNSIPSRTTIYGRLINAFQVTFGITLPIWGQNILRAISMVFAGEFRLAYIMLASLQKNIWVDTCDADMLNRYGKVKLNRYPFPATQGVYLCSVTGTSGAYIPGQTTFKADDTSENPGALFILDSTYTLTASTGIITLRALVAGTGSRLSVSDTLTSTSPLINVGLTATVTTESVIPNDAETTEEYRAKVLSSFQSLPSGDNGVSYREQGSVNISGVQNIYPYATSGAANEIDIYVEAILADSTDGKGTPTSTIMTAVETALATIQGITVWQINYYPVTLKQIDVNINMTGLTALTTAQQALVLNAINNFLFKARPFIASIDALSSRSDIIGAFNIAPAIAAAIPGVPFGLVTFNVNSVSETTYQFDNGAIPWLNSVTYV